MGEQEKQTENPDEIANIVKMILQFNRQQQGQGLKILNPNQIVDQQITNIFKSLKSWK